MEPLHVAVAVVVDADGRVLLMRRLPGTHMAGRWEFPGGKLESGEDIHAGMRRELREELGVTPRALRPLIRIRHAYPGREVLLDCWRIDAWDGTVHAREGHALAWATPGALPGFDLLDADRPLARALTLPPRYAITGPGDPDEVYAGFCRLLDAGHTLLRLRARGLDTARYEALAAKALARCRAHGARLLLDAEPALAGGAGGDGVHLAAGRLMSSHARPLPPGQLVAASCHDAAEIAHAAAIGCDFVVLGPVRATPSHPGASPLGWTRFAALADCAGMPVYALGGVSDGDLETAWTHHAQGIAGISAWW